MISEEVWKEYKDLEYYPDKFCRRCGKNIKVNPQHKYRGIPNNL